ncbi:dienelactone hydrolase family protein [Planctomycetota bacterium]
MRYMRLVVIMLLALLAGRSIVAEGEKAEPLKKLSSAQKKNARIAVHAQGKTFDKAMAKVREVGPLSKKAVDDLLKKFQFAYQKQKPGKKNQTLKISAGERRYVVYVPKSYRPNVPTPLVISLHGAGGNGDGEFQWLWQKEVKQWNGLVACPSGHPPGAQWFEPPDQVEFVLALYEEMKKNFNVDTNRVYVNGFSNGGNGAWYYGIYYPFLWGAVCARGGSPPGLGAISNMQWVGVYIIHGTNDQVIECEHDRKAAEKLKELGYDYVYDEVAGGEHVPFLKKNSKVIAYFREHTRNPWPKTINYKGTGKAGNNRVYWIEVAGSSGAYQVNAKVKEGNILKIETSRVDKMVLHISDSLLDLDGELTVTWNGKEVFKGKLQRSLENLVLDLRNTHDRNTAASVHLQLPTGK